MLRSGFAFQPAALLTLGGLLAGSLATAVLAGARTAPARSQEAPQTSASSRNENTNEYAASVGDGNRIEISSPTQGTQLDAYLRHLLTQLQQSWVSFIPDEARNRPTAQVTAVFEILRNGQISKGDPRVVSGSGNAELDKAAVYAIRFWRRYDALPAGFQGADLKVQVHFLYNVSRITSVEIPPALLPGRVSTGIVRLSHSGLPDGVDILSDTQGVNFTPYVNRILAVLKQRWLELMPEEAKMGQRGATYVTLEILPDGSLSPEGVLLERGTGVDVLDKAALKAVDNSTPFEALPHEFHGPYLKLRIVFFYNEKPEDAGLKTGKE